MKIILFSGSRADRNGLDMVATELARLGHTVNVFSTASNRFEDAVDSAQAVIRTAADALDAYQPDLAVVAGDRYETVASALACVIAGVSIAHVAGGDVTTGSADDRYRDAITALASVHFTSTQAAKMRIDGMMHLADISACTGSPAIDRILQTRVLDQRAMLKELNMEKSSRAKVLVQVHPNTVTGDPLTEMRPLLNVLDELAADIDLLFIAPNADPGGDEVFKRIGVFCLSHHSTLRHNLRPQLYYSVLANFDMMIGNSSAGLYEAPSFGIPVVNIGERQNGRIKAANVISCAATEDGIRAAMQAAMKTSRNDWPMHAVNPYGDGKAAPRIAKLIHKHAARFSTSRKASAVPA